MDEKNHKGEWCPYTDIFCQEGYCSGCEIFLEHKKGGIKKKNGKRLEEKSII